MEAEEAELLREKHRYEGRQQGRKNAVANLAKEWDKPDFTMEQKQAAIAQTLEAVIIKPVGKGNGSIQIRSCRYSGGDVGIASPA